MSRWKAAGLHFTLSVVIAVTLVLVMLAVWYPPPYFTLMGGATLVFLIVGCDVVLGPLITLIIFRAGKKGLAFDLTAIGIVQTLALAFGIYTMFEARPAFTVFAVDRFEVVAANDIRPEELARAARPEFGSLPLTGPRIVAALPPTDPDEKMRLGLAVPAGGEDIKNLPRLYVTYDSVAMNAARRAMPLATLKQKNANDPKAAAEVARLPGQQDALGYLPIVGRFHDMSVIVDKQTGRIETIVDAQPW